MSDYQEARIAKLEAAIQDAVDHCEGWRKFQEDAKAVPFFPRTLEDKLRAALCAIDGFEESK